MDVAKQYKIIRVLYFPTVYGLRRPHDNPNTQDNMNMFDDVGFYLRDNNLKLATAESCTAGMISSLLAETPGSSQWLEAGFVVYSAQAKNTMLGVLYQTIEQHDITSTQVAEEMAKGAIINSIANIAVSTTGLAGPSGGTEKIPVGTVCFGWSFKNNNGITSFSEKKHFEGDRNAIREQAAHYALNMIAFYHEKAFKNNQKLKP